MYQVPETREIVTSGNLVESRDFSIKANGKAFKVLIDGLYTDKITAVVRELLTNARDSHAQAGNLETPFLISMPSQLDLSFSVRDYGVGMTHDFVMDLYSTVFHSTKEDNNLEVGKLGLGSKSPFAYTDMFSLDTWDGTTQRTYTAYIGEEYIPRVTLISEVPSTEPRGCRVSFPVNNNDVYHFHASIRSVLLGFDVVPAFTNDYVPHEKPEPSLRGTNWAYYNEGGYRDLSPYALARQGCVLYPLKDLKPQTDSDCSEVANISGLVIDFPIGTLDIVASREALSYDKTTLENIFKTLKKVQEELHAAVFSEIKPEKSAWDTAKSVRDVCAKYAFFGAPLKRLDCIKNNPKFNSPSFKGMLNIFGTSVDFPRYKYFSLTGVSSARHRRVDRLLGTCSENISIRSFETITSSTDGPAIEIYPLRTVFFVNYLKDNNKKTLKRVRQALDTPDLQYDGKGRQVGSGTHIIVVDVQPGMERTFLKTMVRLGRPPLIDISKLPDYVPQVTSGAASSKKKTMVKVFARSSFTDEVAPTATAQAPVYFVPLVRDEVTETWGKDEPVICSTYGLDMVITKLVEMGVITSGTKIYGVNTSVKSAASQPHWINLFDIIKPLYQNNLSEGTVHVVEALADKSVQQNMTKAFEALKRFPGEAVYTPKVLAYQEVVTLLNSSPVKLSALIPMLRFVSKFRKYMSSTPSQLETEIVKAYETYGAVETACYVEDRFEGLPIAEKLEINYYREKALANSGQS